MKRDYRVQPSQASAQESLAGAVGLVGDHLISLKGLWPRRADYAELPRSWGRDLLAGVTVGVVALPLALGFGVASGAGAAGGLITAVVAGIVAAVFGGSHLQISGPTGAMTVVLLPVIAQYGVQQVPLLAVLAGVLVVLMGLTAMGRAIEMVPFPVVEGFTTGIGAIILLQQCPLLLGAPKGESESTLMATYQTLQHTDWPAAVWPLMVAGLTVVLHLPGRRFPKLPISLLAIAVATVVVELAALPVERIGALPSGLPAPALPAFDLVTLQDLAAPALAVAALAALESLLSARVADGMVPDIGRTQPDRELVGQGLANLASGLFGGLPATGAIARTAVNVRSGGRTRLASITHAVVLLAIMLALGPIVSRIPLAALGGVLVVVALRMVNPAVFRTIFRTTRADRNTFVITLLATVFLDLVAAVLLGAAMAAMMSLRHMAKYSIVRRQYLPADTREGVIDYTPEQERLRDRIAIFRVDGALFYGDASRFTDLVTGVEGVAVVILRFHRMHILDASGGEALKDTVRQLSRRGIAVIAQGMTKAQLRTVTSMGALDPALHVLELSQAIQRAAALVDSDGRRR
ncbi:MAG: SulP family inorganic anion transporter [Micropruina sp.]|uniref:SulP family inorganic anion transporter n=1 Tax=Micropruina sp. TaxID=2737536 RepID=UPI0039E33E04